MRKTLLISIKPKYAAMIYRGEKTVELRKSRPKVEPGDTVIIYETSPVKAVTGVFEVENVVVHSDPEWLLEWLCVGYKIGIITEEYRRYFENSKKAVGILIKNPKPADNLASFARLREIIDGFRPPQSFMYLDEREAEELLGRMFI